MTLPLPELPFFSGFPLPFLLRLSDEEQSGAVIFSLPVLVHELLRSLFEYLVPAGWDSCPEISPFFPEQYEPFFFFTGGLS